MKKTLAFAAFVLTVAGMVFGSTHSTNTTARDWPFPTCPPECSR